MIRFDANYFDGKTSISRTVIFTLYGKKAEIRGVDTGFVFTVPLVDCEISPAIGNTPRLIRLPGGAMCEAVDLDAVAALEELKGEQKILRLVHFIEGRWKAALVSIAGIIIFAWFFVVFGIPAIAEKAAFAVSADILNEVSNQTLEVLENRFLKPSELDQSRIDKLRRDFEEVLADVCRDEQCRVEFRKSPVVGPNAFALPSGLIIVTDELVEASENERELIGILLHEAAHIKERHGLRGIIQNTGVFIMVSVFVGDVASITSIAASLPTLLAQAGYSREFEREADEYAVRYFHQKGWDTESYREILVRITEKMTRYPGDSLLSSHPITEERVEDILKLEEALAGG
ncbi:MAG: M48 family metallopeptidase [Nitrospira sp.]|nr:M48 family metallopeptidase [bacterium]MBL7048249.1 M48 family metallopeptidase [Nitrospira sp.]